jgi:hypothetical protein
MIEKINSVFGNVIFTYTRAQAIEDGVLIDVTANASKAGFKIPVAVTDSIWNNLIEWTDADTDKQTYQDSNGRLWDVLSMLHFAITKAPNAACIFYKLNVVPRDGKSNKAKLVQLKAVIGAGDNGEAVITIMLPNED